MNISESKLTQVFVLDEYNATPASAGDAKYSINTTNGMLTVEKHDGSKLNPVFTIPVKSIVNKRLDAAAPIRKLKRSTLAFAAGVSVVTGTEYTASIYVRNLRGLTKPTTRLVSYVAKANDTTSTVLQKIINLIKQNFEDKTSWLYNLATVDTTNFRVDEKLTPFIAGQTQADGAQIEIMGHATAAGIDWLTVTKSELIATIPNGRIIANYEWAYASQRELATYGTVDPRLGQPGNLIADPTASYNTLTLQIKTEGRGDGNGYYSIIIASDTDAIAPFADALYNELNS